jgi:hypothetical protein
MTTENSWRAELRQPEYYIGGVIGLFIFTLIITIGNNFNAPAVPAAPDPAPLIRTDPVGVNELREKRIDLATGIEQMCLEIARLKGDDEYYRCMRDPKRIGLAIRELLAISGHLPH